MKTKKLSIIEKARKEFGKKKKPRAVFGNAVIFKIG